MDWSCKPLGDRFCGAILIRDDDRERLECAVACWATGEVSSCPYAEVWGVATSFITVKRAVHADVVRSRVGERHSNAGRANQARGVDPISQDLIDHEGWQASRWIG